MRALSLTAVTIVVAIAACSNPASPIAMSDDPSLVAGGGSAHFLGGKSNTKMDVRGKHGHGHDGDHRDKPECGDDSDRDHHDRWGKHGHSSHHSKGHKGHDARGSKRYFHTQSYDSDEGQSEECGGGDGGGGDGGGSEDLPGTISGSVMNDGAAANGFPVFLMSPGGTAIVANTITGVDGSYSFADVAPGEYLVCEADPFVELYGFLGETRPQTGPPCPAGYAPRGFMINLGSGATAGGNDFSNFGLT